MIGTAVVAVLSLSRLVGPDAAGRALVGSLPAPPAAGSCLAASAYGLNVVPCDAPHQLEVAAAWSAWDDRTGANELPELARACRKIGRQYVAAQGHVAAESAPTAGWQPTPMNFYWDLMGGPDGRFDPVGWRACVVVPQGSGSVNAVRPFTGSLTELRPMAARPEALRTCFSGGGSVPPAVPCTWPHSGEVFAEEVLDLEEGTELADVLVDPARRDSCLHLVADLIAAPDPTFGGRLRIDIDGSAQVPRLTTDPSSGAIVSLRQAHVRCVAVAIGDVRLDGSLIGLGANPLPVG